MPVFPRTGAGWQQRTRNCCYKPVRPADKDPYLTADHRATSTMTGSWIMVDFRLTRTAAIKRKFYENLQYSMRQRPDSFNLEGILRQMKTLAAGGAERRPPAAVPPGGGFAGGRLRRPPASATHRRARRSIHVDRRQALLLAGASSSPPADARCAELPSSGGTAAARCSTSSPPSPGRAAASGLRASRPNARRLRQ